MSRKVYILLWQNVSMYVKIQVYNDEGVLQKEFQVQPGEITKLSEAKVRFDLRTPTGRDQKEFILKAKPQTHFVVHDGVWYYSTNTLGAAAFSEKEHEKQELLMQKNVKSASVTLEEESGRIEAQHSIRRFLDEVITPTQLTLLELGIPVQDVFPNSEAIEKPEKKGKKSDEIDDEQDTL